MNQKNVKKGVEDMKKWEPKKKQTAEEKREAEKRWATYVKHRKCVVDGDLNRWETVDECLERVAMEEAEKKQQWEKEHVKLAAEEQKRQEMNRLLPKDEEMSDKKFRALVRSVDWYSTPEKLDAVLNQMSCVEWSKLWCETPLWYRAKQRKLIRNVEITGEFLRGCGISEKKLVHVELDASARASDTVLMSVVNRDRK